MYLSFITLAVTYLSLHFLLLVHYDVHKDTQKGRVKYKHFGLKYQGPKKFISLVEIVELYCDWSTGKKCLIHCVIAIS